MPTHLAALTVGTVRVSIVGEGADAEPPKICWGAAAHGAPWAGPPTVTMPSGAETPLGQKVCAKHKANEDSSESPRRADCKKSMFSFFEFWDPVMSGPVSVGGLGSGPLS